LLPVRLAKISGPPSHHGYFQSMHVHGVQLSLQLSRSATLQLAQQRDGLELRVPAQQRYDRRRPDLRERVVSRAIAPWFTGGSAGMVETATMPLADVRRISGLGLGTSGLACVHTARDLPVGDVSAGHRKPPERLRLWGCSRQWHDRQS